MRNLTWVICMWLIVAACNEKEASEQLSREIRTLNSFKLSPIADSLFNEYIKVVPAAPAYAFFIDKKTGTQEYMLTIAPFTNAVKSMYESGAANYFMLSDTVPVFLYTGLEDFIASDTSEFTKAKERPNDMGEFKGYDAISRKVDFAKSWSYVHLDTISYVVKGNNYPFISNVILKPTIQFIAPDSATK